MLRAILVPFIGTPTESPGWWKLPLAQPGTEHHPGVPRAVDQVVALLTAPVAPGSHGQRPLRHPVAAAQRPDEQFGRLVLGLGEGHAGRDLRAHRPEPE